jgi:hypothetical protein
MLYQHDSIEYYSSLASVVSNLPTLVMQSILQVAAAAAVVVGFCYSHRWIYENTVMQMCYKYELANCIPYRLMMTTVQLIYPTTQL